MARRRCDPEEIVSLPRQAEVLQGQGTTMTAAILRLSSLRRSGGAP